MGFFSKKISYPELDSSDPAARQIQEVAEPLKDLITQISDPLEVIPADGQAYVFIGKPPKKFGVAMIQEGEVKSFVAAAKEKGLDPLTIQKLNEKFRDAYTQNMDAKRYTANVEGKEVVVTPCDQLAEEVQVIMDSI